jgi:membrane-associated phospholipid phosphatase
MNALIRSFVIVVILCVICYFWVDKPVAFLMYRLHGSGTGPLGSAFLATMLTDIVYFIAIGAMGWYAYEELAIRKDNRFVRCVGLTSLSIPITYFIKTNLQYLLGRLGPRYYDSPVLLFSRKDTLYGFQFFTPGSFPSGHMCVFSAALMIPCYFYPKFKKFAVVLLGILGFLLLFENYHFLSDVIAGTYLGVLIAMGMFRLNLLGAPTVVPCPVEVLKVTPQNGDISREK